MQVGSHRRECYLTTAGSRRDVWTLQRLHVCGRQRQPKGTLDALAPGHLMDWVKVAASFQETIS